MTAEAARADLVALLRMAHAGELAAALAYVGHARSVRDPDERATIERIHDEELAHRAVVAGMLAELGAGPDPRQERRMRRIGRSVSAFCRVGGWFGPMYGAGRIERNNVGEYERAAGYAVEAGLAHLVPALVEMSEVEWDHERWFREKAASHWLWRLFPRWDPPPPKEEIRRHLDAALHR